MLAKLMGAQEELMGLLTAPLERGLSVLGLVLNLVCELGHVQNGISSLRLGSAVPRTRLCRSSAAAEDLVVSPGPLSSSRSRFGLLRPIAASRQCQLITERPCRLTPSWPVHSSSLRVPST